MSKGNIANQYYSENAQSDSVVKVDLLRRANEYELANSVLAKAMLGCTITGLMKKLLFEQVLLYSKDDSCYSEEEAFLYFKSLNN
jgi:hypothetical protein